MGSSPPSKGDDFQKIKNTMKTHTYTSIQDHIGSWSTATWAWSLALFTFSPAADIWTKFAPVTLFYLHRRDSPLTEDEEAQVSSHDGVQEAWKHGHQAARKHKQVHIKHLSRPFYIDFPGTKTEAVEGHHSATQGEPSLKLVRLNHSLEITVTVIYTLTDSSRSPTSKLVVELKLRPSGQSEDGAELRVEKKTDVFHRLFLYLISPLLTNVGFL